jgi:hypothetical protein
MDNISREILWIRCKFKKTAVHGGMTMKKEVHKIEDQQVVLADNTVTRLSRFWKNGPLVLVFLRHYG